jgi:poly-gamma-glutamate capsule biosynthesis protein CapA/YwtB (metallophosphatase superfamily)
VGGKRRVVLLVSAVGLALAFLCPEAFASWDGGHDVVGCASAGRTWYFAEGTTREGFNEWVCLLNPNSRAATASFTYMFADGDTSEKRYDLPANSRTTVDVNREAGAGKDVSIKINSTAAIVAERPMYFRYNGVWTGGHDVMGAINPRLEWYFAEGTCRPGFDSYICVQNPIASDARVLITYMLGDGSIKKQSLTVEKNSRSTVVVNKELGQGDDPAHDFSAKVESTNSVEIVAERSMYFAYKGAWTGGHDVVGALAPAPAFYFAEGTCRPGFDPYICVQNPGSATADVRITYMLGDGSTVEQTVAVGKNSRATIPVKDRLGAGDDSAHDFSARVETTNSTEIIAERPIYFAYKGALTGGHDVIGAQAPAPSFYFAEGSCRPGFDPYICVQNPEDTPADVKVTYMLGDGGRKDQTMTVAANSRYTIEVKRVLGEADDDAHDFSAKVEAESGSAIVVERPMYFDYYSSAQWTLSAVGDVNLGGDVSPILGANGFAYPWSALGELLRSTTLTFANMECTLSYAGSPVPGKTFTFGGDPAAIPFMRDDGGVDVVSQANNHARDYGSQSLVDCLSYLDSAGVKHCGAGADYPSAHTPAYLDANGLRVAFLAYDDIGYAGWYAGEGYPGVCDAMDTAGIAADITRAREAADLVVVSFHWGTERKTTPDPRQTDLGRLAIDCGADLVLGHHPHVVQGFQLYKGKLIANSLGNFVFSPGSEAGRYSVLTRLEMDSRGFHGATVYPAYISNGRPALMGGAAGQSWISQVAGLSQALGTPARVENGVMYFP